MERLRPSGRFLVAPRLLAALVPHKLRAMSPESLAQAIGLLRTLE